MSDIDIDMEIYHQLSQCYPVFDCAMKPLSKHWRMIIGFSILGFAAACSHGAYLWLSYPHQNLRVMGILDVLCPPSFLMAIYVDVPGTTANYVVTWAEITVLNAGL